ncbi:MAG: hypothetical protein ACM3L6_04090 [Deltaproteobacteria bacterium]
MTNLRAFRSAVFIKGLSAVIAQTLLLRELLAVFGGNELTVGIMFVSWLLAGAAGSAFFARPFGRLRPAARGYAACLLLFLCALPAALLIARLAHPLLGLAAGEVLTLGQIVLVCGAVLAPLALADGALFTLACRWIDSVNPSARGTGSVGAVYLFECLGALAGGILFTFLLLRLFSATTIVFLVCLLDAAAFACLAATQRRTALRGAAVLLAAAAVAGMIFAGRLQRWSLEKQWPQGTVLVSENSLAGNITITRQEDQFNVFYDGVPILAVPNPDTATVEDLVDLTLLAKPASQRVLFIGHAAGGFLGEILKYPVRQVTAIEPDPVLMRLLARLPVPSIQKELRDPRVTVAALDPRRALDTTDTRFDVVFLHAGLPTSLAANRTYTRDFFARIDRHLSPDGVCAVTTWGSLTFLSDPLKRVNAGLEKTLASVFPYVEAIPGDSMTIFLASRRPVPLDPKIMAGTQKRLAIPALLVNPSYLNIRLNEDDRRWFKAMMTDALRQAQPNTDLRPCGLYDALALSYAQFSKKLPLVFSGFRRTTPGLLAALLLAFGFLGRFLGRRRRQGGVLKLAVFTSGFYSMSAYMTTLLAFQAFWGILYAWLGVFTAAFMAGTAAGAAAGRMLKPARRTVKTLIAVEILIPALVTALALLIVKAFSSGAGRETGGYTLFLLTGFLTGTLVGIELPLVYGIYRRGDGRTTTTNEEATDRDTALAGQLYGLDLAGACLGSFAVPLLLIPSRGIPATLAFLLALKLLQALALRPLARERRSRLD